MVSNGLRYRVTFCITSQMQPGDSDFDTLVGEHFAFCRGKFCLRASAEADCHSCQDLLDGNHLRGILERHAAQYPQADPRASASIWTMYYFSNLIISPLILWLLHRRTLPLAPERTSASFDAKTSLSLGFVVEHFGVERQAGTIFEAMDETIHAHAGALIDVLAENGLSPKLLWSNLAVYGDWVIRDIGDRIDPELRDSGLALFDSETWPGRGKNPLFNLLRRHRDEGCDEITRRRVCCLRYILPGIQGCGMVCPLPQGRD